MTDKSSASSSTVTGALEVESKFTAGPSVVVPTFDFIPGVASTETEVRELSAMYLDTADLRLTRSKHTLRRRTGGPDEGWHLKAPATGGRMEYHASLDAGSVTGEGADADYVAPSELLEPVRSIIRNFPLQAIAQVDNSRHVTTLFDAERTPIAEFCDDHVTAMSFLAGGGITEWREWEIELIGDYADSDQGKAIMSAVSQVVQLAGAVPSESPSKLRTALGESFDNAPVPPAPADLPEGTPGRAVVDALAANVEKLVAIDPAVRRDEWDSVHQMRVATRELRSHLQTFHGIVVGDTVHKMEKELKQLASVLGVARDAEVVAERFEAQLQRPQAEVIGGELRENLVNDIRKDYRKAHRHVVFALNSNRYLMLLNELEELLANPPIQVENADELAKEQATEQSDEETAAQTVPKDQLVETTVHSDSASDTEHDEATSDSTESEVDNSADQSEHSTYEATTVAEEKSPEEIRQETNAVLAAHLRSAFSKFKRRHASALAGRDDASLSGAKRDERFHDVRKAAKKLRYSAEAAQAAGLPTKKLYAACKKLQSSLGDFQDTCTARTVLFDKAQRSSRAGRDTFGYGVLYHIEQCDGLNALSHYDDDVEAVLKAFSKMEKKLDKKRKGK